MTYLISVVLWTLGGVATGILVAELRRRYA